MEDPGGRPAALDVSKSGDSGRGKAGESWHVCFGGMRVTRGARLGGGAGSNV